MTPATHDDSERLGACHRMDSVAPVLSPSHWQRSRPGLRLELGLLPADPWPRRAGLGTRLRTSRSPGASIQLELRLASPGAALALGRAGLGPGTHRAGARAAGIARSACSCASGLGAQSPNRGVAESFIFADSPNHQLLVRDSDRLL